MKDKKETKLLKDVSQRAFHKAYKNAINKHGYVIMAMNGWIVKKFKNGDIKKLFKF